MLAIRLKQSYANHAVVTQVKGRSRFRRRQSHGLGPGVWPSSQIHDLQRLTGPRRDQLPQLLIDEKNTGTENFVPPE